MNLSVASWIRLVQSWGCVSIYSYVELVTVGKSWLAEWLTYPSQFSFLNCRRGLMVIAIGLHEMVAIMEMLSEEVVGPGCSLQLWNVWLLTITMSGYVVLLCRIKVGKCGPKYLQRSWLIRVIRLRPTGLLSACPIVHTVLRLNHLICIQGRVVWVGCRVGEIQLI